MKSKKGKVIWSLAILGILLSLPFVFGWFRTFTLISDTNEPTLKKGSRVYLSNLITPKPGDFVQIEEVKDSPSEDQIFRLIAKAGETVEIRNGECFVNNGSVDQHLNLKKRYSIPVALKDAWKKKYDLNPLDLISFPYMDSALAYVSDDKILKEDVQFRSILYQFDLKIYNRYTEEWTLDNFGPFVVPEGHVFLLGDHRNRCIDSRYFGAIPIEKIIGVVF